MSAARRCSAVSSGAPLRYTARRIASPTDPSLPAFSSRPEEKSAPVWLCRATTFACGALATMSMPKENALPSIGAM